MITLLLALWLSLPSITASPATLYTPHGEFVTIQFAPGAIWTCVVFENQERDYSPRKCWGLTVGMSSYQEDWTYINTEDADWLVWAFIQYEQVAGTFLKVETNRVEIHR